MIQVFPVNLQSVKIIKYSFFFILFLFGNNAPAAAQEVLDLGRSIQIGLEQNFSLQVARNREDIAAKNYTKGNAGMLPRLSASYRYGGTINSTHQNLSEGGENNINNVHNTSGNAGITLGMTIFRGFQAQNVYQKLGEQAQLEQLYTQMSIEDLVARIASEYNYYLQQQILYKNMAYAVSLSRERVRIDEQRYLLGSASKMQLLQSQVYLNADSSRYTSQNEVLRSSQIRLNELLAVDNLGENFIIEDTLIQLTESLNYDSLLMQALTYNTSLQIASKNQLVSELDYKIVTSRSYPYLEASTGYGYNHNGYEQGAFRNQQVWGFNYGLTLGIDIFDGNNRRRERAVSRIEIENREIQYNEVEQSVKADLLTIYSAYENNLRLIRLEEQNLETARENLTIALERYKLGDLAGIELREVQKSLLDAEERLISVKYQTKLAEISLLQISGNIMDYL